MFANPDYSAYKVAANRPNKWAVVELTAQGSLLEVKFPNRYKHRDTDKFVVRGEVTEFTRKSRMRLLKTFARMDKGKLVTSVQKPKFVTLTYPSNKQNHQQAQRDLDTFLKRITRRFPTAWCVWRKELQERGAIHFHMIFGNVGFIHYSKIQEWWGEVIGEDRPFTDIKAIRSYNGVMHYASKYVAKVAEDAPETPQIAAQGDDALLSLSMCHISPQKESTGRWWGVYGRQFIPLANRVRRRVYLKIEQLGRLSEAINSDYASHESGFSIFGDNPYQWVEQANRLQNESYEVYLNWKQAQNNMFARERNEAADQMMLDSELHRIRKARKAKERQEKWQQSQTKLTSQKTTISEKLSLPTNTPLFR